MVTVREVPRLVEIAYYEQPHEGYEPTHQDWEDYRAQLEHEEAMERLERLDRTEEMERQRRCDFNAARSAACIVRGIATALRCEGQSGVAERLLAASDDVMSLVSRYA